MKKKEYTLDKTYYLLKDISIAYAYGDIKSDKRLQVVMPKVVVEELDKEFPNIDRSKLLTQLVLEALLVKKRYAFDPDMEELALEEQYDLDRMLDYLEEEERNDKKRK